MGTGLLALWLQDFLAVSAPQSGSGASLQGGKAAGAQANHTSCSRTQELTCAKIDTQGACSWDGEPV